MPRRFALDFSCKPESVLKGAHAPAGFRPPPKNLRMSWPGGLGSFLGAFLPGETPFLAGDDMAAPPACVRPPSGDQRRATAIWELGQTNKRLFVALGLFGTPHSSPEEGGGGLILQVAPLHAACGAGFQRSPLFPSCLRPWPRPLLPTPHPRRFSPRGPVPSHKCKDRVCRADRRYRARVPGGASGPAPGVKSRRRPSACHGRCSWRRAPAACRRARPWPRPSCARPWPSWRAP
jgi:hypothetical protein